jgi:protein-disulfide isomerase
MRTDRPTTWRCVLDVIATVMMIAASAAILALAALAWLPTAETAPPPEAEPATATRRSPATRPTPPLPSEPVSLEGATLRGDRHAPLVVITYTDFECPACAAFAHDTLPSVLEHHVATGKVLLAVRHTPLPRHRLAFKAAEASLCSARWGKFWEMHEALFALPMELDPASLVARARTLGLDVAAFETCLGGETTAQVEHDLAEARRLQVTATPTVFFGRVGADGRVTVLHRESGAIPRVPFERILQAVADGQISMLRVPTSR